MFKQTAASVVVSLGVVGLSLLNAGCRGTEMQNTATGPGEALSSEPASFATIHPAFVTPQLIVGSSCPISNPLRAVINLSLHADLDATLQLTEVRLIFVDSLGISAPPVTLPSPVLTRQFGTALVHARSTRLFPIDFGFGCGLARHGTIVVSVRYRDGHGRDGFEELRVRVQ